MRCCSTARRIGAVARDVAAHITEFSLGGMERLAAAPKRSGRRGGRHEVRDRFREEKPGPAALRTAWPAVAAPVLCSPPAAARPELRPAGRRRAAGAPSGGRRRSGIWRTTRGGAPAAERRRPARRSTGGSARLAARATGASPRRVAARGSAAAVSDARGRLLPSTAASGRYTWYTDAQTTASTCRPACSPTASARGKVREAERAFSTAR